MPKKTESENQSPKPVSNKAKLILLGAILFYVYYPTFLWMIDRWSARDSYYGHGFLIPVVALYWIYRRKKEYRPSQRHISPLMISLLAVGVLAQIIGSVLRIYFISGFSFVLVLLGLTDLLFGRNIFRKTWFPLTFLSLMIPLPLLIISQITVRMKFFAAEASTYLIARTGIPAVREGSYILTPNSILLVGDPCSGLRSFLAFLCLGMVFAYESKMVLWKRTVLVFAGLPLALMSNIARVYFLGLVGEIYGMQHTGPGTLPHDASGILVFIVAFFAFMFLKGWLEKIHD